MIWTKSSSTARVLERLATSTANGRATRSGANREHILSPMNCCDQEKKILSRSESTTRNRKVACMKDHSRSSHVTSTRNFGENIRVKITAFTACGLSCGIRIFVYDQFRT